MESHEGREKCWRGEGECWRREWGVWSDEGGREGCGVMKGGGKDRE